MDGETIAFYQQMSSYEITDLYYTVRDSAVFVVSTFMSVLFAYLATAHFVGKNLSTIEVIAISIIYSVFSMFLFSGIFGSMQTLSNIQEILKGTRFLVVDLGFPVFLVVCWLASLCYMVKTRRGGDT